MDGVRRGEGKRDFDMQVGAFGALREALGLCAG